MKKVNNRILLIIYIAIWLLMLLWFWIGLSPDGAMLYSIVSFYLVLPSSSLLITYIWRTKKILRKCFLPAFFGLMEMLLQYCTFSLANTLSFHHLHFIDYKMAIISAVPSLLGLLIDAGTTIINKQIYYNDERKDGKQ